MQAFKTLTSIAAPLERANIDTDDIKPVSYTHLRANETPAHQV